MAGTVSALRIVRADTGEPALDAWRDTEIIASSRTLSWSGLVAEMGRSASWTPDELAIHGHLAVINLDSEALLTEAKGPQGFAKVVLPPGSLWINPAGAPFSHRNMGASRWGAIELPVEWVRRMLGRDIDPPVRYGLVDEALGRTVRALLVEAAQGGRSGDLYRESLAITIATRLAELAGGKDDDSDRALGSLAPHRLRRVKDKIESTLTNGVTVEELAQVAGLSPAHFARSFKRQTNESPHAFVLRRRTERAWDLMAAGVSIADAAIGCGFADQAHLSRVFKRRFGITPGAFVRRAREVG